MMLTKNRGFLRSAAIRPRAGAQRANAFLFRVGIALMVAFFGCQAVAQDLSPTAFIGRNVPKAPGLDLMQAQQIELQGWLRLEFNNNVTLADDDNPDSPANESRQEFVPRAGNAGGKQSDWITEVHAEASLVRSITRSTKLALNLGVGYRKHLERSELDGVVMTVPTEISYTFYTEGIRWTLRDHFFASSDPANEPELTGVDEFGRFTNVIGLDAAWSWGRYFNASAGYEHFDYFATTTNARAQEHSSDSFRLMAGYALAPSIQLGVSGSVTDTRYSAPDRNDSTAYSLGFFLQGSLSPATTLFLSTGFQTIELESSDFAADAGDPGYYGTLELRNQLNRLYSHSLVARHEIKLGILSDTLTLDTVRYSASLLLRRDIALSGYVFLERGDQSGGQAAGEKFTRHGAGMSIQVVFTRKLQVEFGWRHLARSSETEGRDYEQGRVFAMVSYRF